MISAGLEFISDWKDNYGNYLFNQYLGNNRLIVNKVTTGCGFTTFCLRNREHTILVSPRVAMLQNKMEQINTKNNVVCFYFDREKKGKKQKSIQDIENDFAVYLQDRQHRGEPLKILVTYDSFSSLADMLEVSFKFDINAFFRIAVDESHCIVKDVPMKEYGTKCVLSNFLNRLFKYEKLLFISATPIVKYVGEIKEFKLYPVDYVELKWSNIEQVTTRTYSCKNAQEAFSQIFKQYSDPRHVDPQGRHYFDVVYQGINQAFYSYEAVIFLNSVGDIGKILKKYTVNEQLIDPNDVTVICAKTKENHQELRKYVGSSIKIAKCVPPRGAIHRTWTFVTRTAFEGVDFYSTNASTFVVADYNVKSLCIDIASDIPQIIGRQREKCNLFRKILHIFFTNSKKIICDTEFEAMQKDKEKKSKNQILLWQNQTGELKDTAYENLVNTIESKPSDYYIKIRDGVPELYEMIKISEQYSRDILKNHTTWFIMSSVANSQQIYTSTVQELKDKLVGNLGMATTKDRVKVAYPYFTAYPQLATEFLLMLHKEGFSDIGRYYHSLTLDRIKANGCDPWKMDNEIANQNKKSAVDPKIVASKFKQGEVYSKKAVKEILQDLYNSLGIKQTAKANELEKYISCSIVKKDGLKAYKIN